MFRKRTKTERFWEILPGFVLWSVFVFAVFISRYQPIWAAVFIVCFDLYWVIKALNVSIHLITSYRIFRLHVTINWLDYVKRLSGNQVAFLSFLSDESTVHTKRIAKKYFKHEQERLKSFFGSGKSVPNYRDFYHLLLFPFVDESLEVLSSTIDAVSKTNYEKDRLIIILAAEERAGEKARKIAEEVKTKFGHLFNKFFITVHPDGLPGEIKGKSANASFAVQSVMPELSNLGIGIDQVIVSNFDSDSVPHPQYFARVMYEFLTAEKPYQTSYQPIAIYNNNIWDSPAIIRVVSVANSFWQFTESSRLDRLRTFSSHSMTLRALVEVGFWEKEIVNEDGYIFWQCYLRYNGDYSVVPLFVPVSLDTCLASTTWETFKNQYRQQRRWAYNVEYYPHLIPKLLTNGAPFWNRMYKIFQYVVGDFSWAASSVIISTLGLLPLFVGGQEFLDSVVAFNLPHITQNLIRVAFVFIFFSVYVNMVLLPPRPAKYSKWKTFTMYLQWALVPVVSLFFSSIPAIEAQTRLMLGKYLEFWVTPKVRKGGITAHAMKEMQSAVANVK